MNKHKLVSKGVFEKMDKFEQRLDSLALEGWKAVSLTRDSGTIIVLMEKMR